MRLMVEVEHLMAMSDNARKLIDEMVRWKYEVSRIIWPIRGRYHLMFSTKVPTDDETYGMWFERVFYESLENYRERAEREKIGEKIGASESRK